MTGLRTLFLVYCAALIAIGVVTEVLQSDRSIRRGLGVATAPVAMAVTILGVLSLIGMRVVERPLDGSSDSALVGSSASTGRRN